MRNALNKLADGVTDPAEKKVSTLHISPPTGRLRQSVVLLKRRTGRSLCARTRSGRSQVGLLRHRTVC